MGWLLSAVIALAAGPAHRHLSPIQAFFEPLDRLHPLHAAVAFIPLVMLVDRDRRTVQDRHYLIGTFFQLVLMRRGHPRVPMQQIEAAQTMGAAQGEILSLVILESAKPALLDIAARTMGGPGPIWWSPSWFAAIPGWGTRSSRRSASCRRTRSSPDTAYRRNRLAMDQAFRALHRRRLSWLTRNDDGEGDRHCGSPRYSRLHRAAPWRCRHRPLASAPNEFVTVSAHRAAASPRCCVSSAGSSGNRAARYASMACRRTAPAWIGPMVFQHYSLYPG